MTRVLVVDDSATTRRVVRRALTMSGIPNGGIREAANGLEALSKIAEDEPQLILSDVNMPLMDGFQFLEAMQERGYMGGIPVVMITSRSSMADRKRLLGLGAEAVIKKPFPMHALRTYIEPYLIPEPLPEPVPEPVTVAVTVDEPGSDFDAFGEDEFAGALYSSLKHTLELTAFLEAHPAQVPANSEQAVYYYAALSITDGHQGRLWMAGNPAAVEQFLEAGAQGNAVALRADALTELVNALAGEFCADLLGAESDYAFGLPVCDVLVGSDDRLDGGYVFALEDPEQILLVGYQPGVEAIAGDFGQGAEA